MTVIEQLASVQGRRDEAPNVELAARIVAAKDKGAVKELVALLRHKSKDIQSDSIKVLYEVGEQAPSLIAGHAAAFIDLLEHKNNRLQWGAMTALDALTGEDPKRIYAALPAILKVADAGSVITKDHAVNILIKLCANKTYQKAAFSLLLEQLNDAPTNQLPMYAERAIPIINDSNKKPFIAVLTARLDEFDKESKRKRVEKVIKKVG